MIDLPPMLFRLPDRTKDDVASSSRVEPSRWTVHLKVTTTVRSELGLPSEQIQNVPGEENLGSSPAEVYSLSVFRGILMMASWYHFLVCDPAVEDRSEAVMCSSSGSVTMPAT